MPVDTKSMIADTFVKLSQKKNLDKITIKDIVEMCGISRQAFYYHFEDITGVIDWSIQIKMQKVFEQSLQHENPRDSLLFLITGILDSSEGIRRLYTSQHKDHIEQIFIQTFCSLFKEFRARKKARKAFPTVNEDTTLRFLAYGLSGILKDAIYRGYRDAEFLCDEIYALVRGTLEI